MRFFVIALALVLCLGFGVLYAVVQYGSSDMPSTARLSNIEPPVKTQVFDSAGRVLADLYRENRSYVSMKDIPQVMIDAVLSIEDRRFYQHWGLDLFRIAGAAVKNVREGGRPEGASTITQQLARNLFLTHDQTLERKIKEQILALRIEEKYSKDEILELYLNQIYFGDGAYGIQSAAHRFLGKDIRDVSVAEAALLAGLPRNPRDYSPRRHPDVARRRRTTVLRAMLDNKAIDQATFSAADAETVMVSSAGERGLKAPYFVEMVRQYLDEKYGGDAVFGGGLKVYTTLDLPLQDAAERALARQLDSVAEMAGHKATYGSRADDSERREAPARTEYIQGAALTVEAKTGAVLMMIGGRDFAESRFNRATQALRQPGSTFKPFVYLAALEAGHTPAESIVDEPATFSVEGGQLWSPQNFDPDYAGTVTLRRAMEKSINIPAVKLLKDVGTTPVIRLARDFGISSRIPPYLSIALGSAEVTVQELTYAYAVIANGGIRVEPYFITKVVDRNGVVLEENRPQSREVSEAAPLYVLTSMLESVMNHGTGAKARTFGFRRPAGGKSGTTNDYSDAWFVGFTPDVVTSVWVGFDERKPIGHKMTGSAAALPAWSEIMIAATQDRPETEFEVPPGVTFLEVCDETGLLATDQCPTPVTDAFLDRFVPQDACDRHGGGLFKRLFNRFRSRPTIPDTH